MSLVVDFWKRSRIYRVLRLGGYVAFDLPRVVSTLGTLLLLGVVGVQVYVSIAVTAMPLYFLIFCAATITCCLLAALALWLGTDRAAPQLGWRAGSVVCFVLIGVYLATRAVSLPGLERLTGRWDVAPGTFTLAFAAGFVAIYLSVLLGINVAYPQRRNWHD